MAIYVNGQLVTREMIAEETARLEAQANFRDVASVESRQQALKRGAEKVAIERTLILQLAGKDPRPIEREQIESEVLRQRTAAGCRIAFDDAFLWREIESQVRVHRLIRELTGGAQRVSRRDLEVYYAENRSQFVVTPMFKSAQIVCHVNERRSEGDALATITAALHNLEAGASFASVAERYSDCKGNGGLLPPYAGGEMVEEYESAVHRLEPGQRTSIFVTAFGFHIARLVSKHPARVASFAEVKAKIRDLLLYERKKSAYITAMEGLLEAAEIRYTEDVDPPAGESRRHN